ncbi:NusB antitermination factor [Luteococcus japonicus]|uniref:Transcription antitermination protein NusB n=2 Tax=Luteococcus japonicus TaxID=33984 RepID=A0A1R4IRK3_9ACTN|nr:MULTISPECIES: transcription antitermination factor NusB [Luteococcus]MDN5563616.1 transcription antitermination factor NusB [Luteococcus sp.]ROR53527.1 NusB antitermination factor [Luteococcus japonicus]SJN22339.1 Transcription termination protein NusB [Luteococcus japonicus LSP_Lj1]
MSESEIVGTPVPGRPDLLKISAEPVPVVPNAHHSTRTKARKKALDILFEAELRDRDLVTTLDEYIALGEPPVREFTSQIIRGIDEHMGEIDQRIAECCSADWTMERMPRVDRNLARIAIWEIDHSETADAAVVSEAVALATEFSTDDSAGFLNGLLATAMRTKQA